jgi:hypothetical protein
MASPSTSRKRPTASMLKMVGSMKTVATVTRTRYIHAGTMKEVSSWEPASTAYTESTMRHG